MKKRNYSVVKRHRLFTILSWLGAIIAVVGYFLEGILHQILPWVGLVLVIGSVVMRFTMVRCPHCGHLLTEGKAIPVRCPKCDEELN